MSQTSLPSSWEKSRKGIRQIKESFVENFIISHVLEAFTVHILISQVTIEMLRAKQSKWLREKLRPLLF